VRPDLPELVSAFASRGIVVRVLTNGIGVSDHALDAVVAAGMEHVSISLDTMDPEKEKDIYGGQDVWEEITDTMRRFRDRMPSRRNVLVMNVCVSRVNLAELPALVHFAETLGFVCSFVPIALSPSEEESDGFAAADATLAVRPEDHGPLRNAYAALLDLKRRGAPIANSSRFLRDSETFLRTGRSEWRCDAGALYLSVNPEGGISICHRFAPIARFDSPSLADILKDPRCRTEARRARAACPGCMRPCWAEVTHAMRDLPSSVEALRTVLRRPWEAGGRS
jgi:MoaA/NifB/PqqE/SkfB family radical SAM enzyme